MVKPLRKARIQLRWQDEVYETVAEADGFFHFEWKPVKILSPGSYPVSVHMVSANNETEYAFSEATVIVPSSTNFAFISDIDDTFLISHSSNLRKRLFVLLTENARSRRPFEGAVKHYQLLAGGKDTKGTSNAFFYVSSSEWNLYNYIREFVRINELPEGVFLLNQLKTFSKLFSTGQNNHNGKFTRIVKIIEAYPDQKFVLLGDDSQKDSEIYAAVVKHFPENIFAVYIRRVGTPEKEKVREKDAIFTQAGVHFCYFAHSEDAIEHSRKIGLINQDLS